MSKPCVIEPGTRKSEFSGKQIRLYVYVLEKKLGRLLRHGYEACHTCDIPTCVESEHLWEGTHAENLRDAYRKGRSLNPGWGAKVNSNKTHCPQGHEYTQDNTRHYRGSRYCKACDKARQRKG